MKSLLFFLFPSLLLGLSPRISAPYAVLMNADSGVVLYERRAHEPTYPASTTKVATALYALKKGEAQLEDEVTVMGHCLTVVPQEIKEGRGYKLPPYWLEPDGVMFGLKKGESYPLLSLIYGLFLTSGNDAANVVADYLASDISMFVRELNMAVRQLGCKKTHFANPHGLHFPTHKTTAYDLALIMKAGLKEPLFRKVIGTCSYLCPKSERLIEHTNRLLHPGRFYYEKALGAKTGYTSLAGCCMVVVAEHEGRTLIAVVLGCENKFQSYRDILALFDAAFAESAKRRPLFNKGENTFSHGEIEAELARDVVYTYYPAEEVEICSQVRWNEVELPINKGDIVGYLDILGDHPKPIESIPLLAKHPISAPPLTRWWMILLFLPLILLFFIRKAL